MNPLLNMLGNKLNPKEMALSMIKSNSNNPKLNELIKMINSNDTNGLKNMAENIAKEKGMTLDEAIASVKNNFSL